VSGRQLDRSDFSSAVDEALRASGLAAQLLTLEITESVLMRDADRMLATLNDLRSLGVRIAIDDFGTGYSSLARLHELPLDELKIDQSFVMRMAREGDETVVRSIIDLAHALGFKVIAEGVESDETWVRLAELGADYVQGYVLTRPLPADDFSEWLAGRMELPQRAG
jgi:EAL domain-containing protein (putative c-di-GMP-specific phosphodiesterase class I)